MGKIILYCVLSFNLIIISCNHHKIENKKLKLGEHEKVEFNYSPSAICNYDSLLFKYALSFEPRSISLQKSINSELDTFLNNVDTICLKKQKKFEFFVCCILLKQYKHHLECCHQGYDLLSMREGSSSLIINGFLHMINPRDFNLEMLNSGAIVDYIQNQKDLKNNTVLEPYLKKIEEINKRIIRGDFK